MKILSPDTSIGFSSAFDIHVPKNHYKHSADMLFDIPNHIEPSLWLENYCAPPVLAKNHRLQAARLRKMLPRAVRVIAVHADTSAEKMWPLPKFRRILNLFLQRNKNFFAIDVGLKNLNLDTGRHADRIVPAYALPLGVAFAVVAKADLFLGFDSCMLHAADLFRVPGVGLFRSTSSVEWGFRFGPNQCFSATSNVESILDLDVVKALERLFKARSQSLRRPLENRRALRQTL